MNLLWFGQAVATTEALPLGQRFGPDFKDLDKTPEATASTTATVAADAAHLARLLRDHNYPPVR